MPHQYLLEQIEKTTTENRSEIAKLNQMIINGRKSTSKFGLGHLINNGVRSTEFFTGLANKENIFHLLARKNLIAEILPTIELALSNPAFIEREKIKLSLGLSGKSLTPSEDQKKEFLKFYVMQKNQEGCTPYDLASPKDNRSIHHLILETEAVITTDKVLTIEAENINPQTLLKKDKLKNLTTYFNNKQKEYFIEHKLGQDYNDLEMFVFLHSTNKGSLEYKIKSSFTNTDTFFETLFNDKTALDFAHKSSTGGSALAIACKHSNQEMADKLLPFYTPEHQSQLIKEAISYNSTMMIEKIATHYAHQTDWNSILFSSIKYGRFKILEANQDNLPFNNKVSIAKGSKNIEYTALNYLLHTIKLMCTTVAKAGDESKAQTYIDQTGDKLFKCFDIIVSKVDLSQDQEKALSLLKQLRNFEEIYERLASNKTISTILDNIHWNEQGSIKATTVGNESIDTTHSRITLHDIKQQVQLMGDDIGSGYDSADEDGL